MGENCANDETNTCVCNTSICGKSMDPYFLVIGLISGFIFFVGFVWFLVRIIKKPLNTTARALDDDANNVATSNPPAPVLGYPSNQMMIVSVANIFTFFKSK